jgi:hypothetical protein
MRGFVYILSNPSMPDLVKIGKTTASPIQRMQELHSTGVPTPFELEFAAEVTDCHASERSAHDALAKHRVSTNREFFRVSVRRAIMEILPVLGDYTLRDVKASHGIEKIEADLRRRREEQEATVRAQEAKRASEERERAREKAQRAAELQRKLASARARFGTLGQRPVEPQLSGLTTLLMCCWVPLPFGWLVWLGSISAFSGYQAGTICIVLLVAGFFAYQRSERSDAEHSKLIEPFLPMEREIENIETAIKNEGFSLSPVPYAGAARSPNGEGIAKVVIRCPTCEQRLRLPANKTLEAACPSCGSRFRTNT